MRSLDGEGEEVFLTGRYLSESPVPEPATMALFGIGLTGMALRCRKQS